MNEIEIKLKIDNKMKLLSKLAKLDCQFSDSIKQEDYIFLSKDVKDFNIQKGMIVIRMRIQNNIIVLTLKQRKDTIMESKEIEFEVSDYNEAKDFLETIGYNEVVQVKKERIETSYKEFNICIDEVENLGTFLEIEILTKENDKASYYEKKILDFISTLEIDNFERINKHYDTMIYEAENN